jgi:Leucine-rich repeat (LRR) protein
MEDYDDLKNGPDASGRLNLAFHQWDTIPSALFSYGMSLKILDLSHNRISDMPNDFGNLLAIRELNLAYNKLRQIDPVTMLIRLRILNVSHNLLTSIPKDIARCTMLVRMKLFPCKYSVFISQPKACVPYFNINVSDLRKLSYATTIN